MRVRFTSTALRQLDAILDHIADLNPQAARRVRDRLKAMVDLLARHPWSGEETSRPGQRRLIANPYPYAMFYRVRGDEVLVQRIRHTARRPIDIR